MIAYLVLAAAALVVAIAVRRAYRKQVALEVRESEDGDPARPWRGAPRYGGGFRDGRAPAEELVRRDWTAIRLMGPLEMTRSKGFPAEKLSRDGTLKALSDWCETHCCAGWMAVVPESASATFWFENPDDAQSFAEVWFPYKCT